MPQKKFSSSVSLNSFRSGKRGAPIQRVGIAVKENDAHSLLILRRIAPLFSKFQAKFDFFVEQGAAKKLKASEALPRFIKAKRLEELESIADLLLVVGGDGTILRCARHLLKSSGWRKCVLLGINAGNTGFLSFLNTRNLESEIESLLSQPQLCRIEPRSCIEMRIRRKNKILGPFHALNDCVLSKGSLSRLFEFHIEVDGAFLSSYRSDGLIVSTPTGSTAYNLAAGGSIIETGIPALQLTPICAQTLSHRPIVLSDSKEIALSLGRHSSDVYLTLDGHTGIKVLAGDRIEISKSNRTVSFLLPPGMDSSHFFQSLRQKLKWGTSLASKA